MEDYINDPEPAPPSFKKKDLIPDLRVFKVFDQYAIQVHGVHLHLEAGKRSSYI